MLPVQLSQSLSPRAKNFQRHCMFLIFSPFKMFESQICFCFVVYQIFFLYFIACWRLVFLCFFPQIENTQSQDGEMLVSQYNKDTKKKRLWFGQTTAVLIPKHRRTWWTVQREPKQPFPSLHIRPMIGNYKQASVNLNQTVALTCRSPWLVWHSPTICCGFCGGKQRETISLTCREKLLDLYRKVTLKQNWSF